MIMFVSDFFLPSVSAPGLPLSSSAEMIGNRVDKHQLQTKAQNQIQQQRSKDSETNVNIGQNSIVAVKTEHLSTSES